jgi:multidrug efflux pump
MFLNMTSATMSRMQLTDYAERYIVDRLATSRWRVADQRVRRNQGAADLDQPGRPRRTRQLTMFPISNSAFRAENLELPAGRIESNTSNLTIRIARGYNTARDFGQLVIKRADDGHLIRLGEVAKVEIANRETSK